MGGKRVLTRRIIPCLDIRDGRVVKGINFVNIRDAGDPVEAAVRYNEAGADELVLLDERGQRRTSLAFASWLEDRLSRGGRDLVFVVGGAYGFGTQVYERADALISLSEMTFSHQIVRTIFAEQLYRAFTIIRGEPYHHQ